MQNGIFAISFLSKGGEVNYCDYTESIKVTGKGEEVDKVPLELKI